LNSKNEIIGEIVNELRSKRLSGAPAAQLAEELATRGVDSMDVNKYFREAFGLGINVSMMPKELFDQHVGVQIDARREQWMNLPPYPDLMRRRDREAFKAVARATGAVLVVCAADREVGQYIGKPGFRCAPEPMPGATRSSEPNIGLLAADPASLESAVLEKLQKNGFRIGGRDEGYLIRDAAGAALFRGYQMHGAYRVEDGVNAWTGNEGEKIRAQLNRKMGAELVRSGPHDQSADRLALEKSNPLRGPKPPVLFFLPDGSVDVRKDARGIELFYRFLKIDWDELYPSVP